MRRATVARALTVLMAVLWLAVLAPAAAVACSCVPPDMIIDTLGEPDDQSVAFSGTVGPAVGNRVPVQVTGWYGGPPPAAIVSLEVDGSDGSSCGTSAPPAGRQFLFVSYETGTGAYGLNLCSVAADLATPEGQATLRAVAAAVGPPFAVASALPEPTLQPPASSGAAELAAIAIPVGGALLLAIVVVAGLFLVAGRRRA
jgi:hypothetical protein